MRIKHTSKQFANESEAFSLISDTYIFSVTFLCDNVLCDTCLLIRDQNRSEKSDLFKQVLGFKQVLFGIFSFC